MIKFISNACFLSVAIVAFYAIPVDAQTIPGPADIGRKGVDKKPVLPPQKTPKITLEKSAASEGERAIPELGTAKTTFVLKDVTIKGMTAFKQEEMADIYKPYVDKTINMVKIQQISQQITKRYHENGYFLSRAYIPKQEIENGSVTLKIVEGFISEIEVDGADIPAFTHISAQKPLKIDWLENKLLLLNDTPGVYYTSVLGQPQDHKKDLGAVKLSFKEVKEPARARVAFSNHGSRYTGPHMVSFAYEKSLRPKHLTTFSGEIDIPKANKAQKVQTLALLHEYRFLERFSLDLLFDYSTSEPGYTLEVNEIESRSLNGEVGLNWYAIRQRKHNLNLGLSVGWRDVKSDILNTTLTREHLRYVKGDISYDNTDPLHGYNKFSTSFTQGLDIDGANNKGDANLSRSAAEPDFFKLNATWQRQQHVFSDWKFTSLVTGQHASKALYSSEEFGFGGPYLGRAYDESELLGDHAIAGSVEMQYTNLKPVYNVKYSPSVFYDVAKIWNIDSGQDSKKTAASAGFAVNFLHKNGMSGVISLAQPIMKSIDTPIYGGNGKSPRLFFQLGYAF